MRNNKSNKIIKNILFIFLVILVIIGICFFNYKMDPYKLFEKKDYMQLSAAPREMIYIIMKGYKNDKSDTVVIGGSDAECLFYEYYFHNYFNTISVKELSYEQYKELLDAYIELHPKTRRVIIIINYINIIHGPNITIPKFSETNFTLKEYQRILFSTDITIKSLIILKNNIQDSIKSRNNKQKKETFYLNYFPKNPDRYDCTPDKLKELEKNNFEKINNLINMLDKKNIDYIFIIPPYHAIFMSLIYKNQKEAQENLDKFRRFLVSVVPEDKKIYDFAFVNKYTSSDFYTNKNGLYITLSHPSVLFGAKILKILCDYEGANHDLYFLLNKDNIEYIIKKEKNLLNEYIKNNEKLFNHYNELYYSIEEENLIFKKRIYKNSLSNDGKKEYEFLEKIKNNKPFLNIK